MEVTDLHLLRRLRFFWRLSYPIAVVLRGDEFVGSLPDLPGCEARAPCIRELHLRLEQERRRWIQRHVLAGASIPMPNEHARRPRPSMAPIASQRPSALA